MRFTVVFAMSLALTLVGCTDDDSASDGGGGCVLGDQEVCACLGGGSGTKECGSNGAFGPCELQSSEAPSVDCEPIDFDHKACHQGDVFWFDTCGQPTAFVETCSPPETSCHNGSCVTGCVDLDERGCDGDKVVTLDSCGGTGAVIETCTGGASCAGGACVEECVSGSDGSCTPNQAVECPCGGGEVGVQTCNADGSAFSACDCGGATGPCESTTTEHHKGCFENAVHWFDDCDVRGEELESCTGDSSCVDGVCQEGCVPFTEKKCNEPGTGLFWFDSCGNQGDLDQLCPDNTICAGDECIAACEPHAAKFCLGDQVYWYNSCDQQESVAEACTEEQFCKGCTVDEQPCSIPDPSCVKPLVDGTWQLVANPNTGDACGLGSSTYPPQDLELVVDGSQSIGPTTDSCSHDIDCADIAETLPPCLEVTCSGEGVCDIDRVEDGPQVCGTIVVLGTVVKFTGTLEGKHLEMTGSWVQEDTTGLSADVPHDETIDVQFTSQSTFEGLHEDSFVLDMSALGMASIPCTQYWNVTGTKK